jgi:hypothetical protein
MAKAKNHPASSESTGSLDPRPVARGRALWSFWLFTLL